MLLFFSFLLGLLYVFITPPWQAPDEFTHYEYIDILSRSNLFKIKQAPDYDLQKEIIQSMDQFNLWNYVFEKPPSTLPEKYEDSEVLEKSLLKINRPPLYYMLGSLLLKVFKTENLLVKHYMIRIFSLFLSMFTILFTFFSAKIVFKGDFVYSVLAAGFIAFLPQFLIVSGSINSDNLENLIGAGSLYAFLYALKNFRKYSVFLIFPFLFLIIFFSGVKNFFIIPAFVFFCVLWLLKNKSFLRSRIFVFLGGAVSLLVIGFLFLFIVFNELGMRIMENFIEPLKFFWVQFFSENYQMIFSKAYMVTFFKSFWCYPGWMAFPLPNIIYSILALVFGLGLAGIVKYCFVCQFKNKRKSCVRAEFMVILIVFVLFSLVQALFRAHPMARYLFPSLSAVALLFAVGLREIFPLESRKKVTISFVLSLIALNIYTVFVFMIKVFYFRF